MSEVLPVNKKSLQKFKLLPVQLEKFEFGKTSNVIIALARFKSYNGNFIIP